AVLVVHEREQSDDHSADEQRRAAPHQRLRVPLLRRSLFRLLRRRVRNAGCQIARSGRSGKADDEQRDDTASQDSHVTLLYQRTLKPSCSRRGGVYRVATPNAEEVPKTEPTLSF